MKKFLLPLIFAIGALTADTAVIIGSTHPTSNFSHFVSDYLNDDWTVVAVAGNEVSAYLLTLHDFPPDQVERLHIQEGYAEWATAEPAQRIIADLKMCPADEFPRCWELIKEHLAPNGELYLWILSNKDDDKGFFASFTNKEALKLLEKDFEIEKFDYIQNVYPVAYGQLFHRRIYCIHARKIPTGESNPVISETEQ